VDSEILYHYNSNKKRQDYDQATVLHFTI